MISRLIAWGIYSFLGKVRVLHGERSLVKGPCILACNHISHFDPPLISVASRRKIDWMAMKDLFKPRFARLYFDSIGTFPVDRDTVDRSAVKTALQRLKRGRMVGMFPEGGIRAGASSVLEGAPMRPGAGAFAQMVDAPVLPCVVLGSDRLYKRDNWKPFGKVPFWIGFGEPIRPPADMDKAQARGYIERELQAAFKSVLAEMREHYQLTVDDLPKTPGERKAEP